MVCQGCFVLGPSPLCSRCVGQLRPAPDQILPGGIRAIAGFVHTGLAARLVHGLKYRGISLAAELAAEVLEPRVSAATLVPVPRVWSRYLRYGVDPAEVVARYVARSTGGVAISLIRRPVHNQRRAGAKKRGEPPVFRLNRRVPGRIVLVDDVLTSGATVMAAVRAMGRERIALVITATAARQVSRHYPEIPDGYFRNQVSSQ